jgi:hypothetical protein
MVARPVGKAPHAANGGHSNTQESSMTTRHLSRRGLFKAAANGVAAALTAPYLAPHLAPHLARVACPPGILKVVLESEVVILDPHFTTAAITRTFG